MTSSTDHNTHAHHHDDAQAHDHHHEYGGHRHHVGHRHAPPSTQSTLFWALLLTGGCMLIEFIGGWVAGSLALLADSGHMLTDCASLAMSYAAVRAASRPATADMNYGHHRWQVLAAFVNGLALLLLAAWIMVEGVERLVSSTEVKGGIVAGVAFAGMLVNLAAFAVLSRGESNLNVRGALAHVIGDLLGSFAALLAGAIIYFTGWLPADPLLSMLVALMMVRSGWYIARESAHILLQGAPAGIAVDRVAAELRNAVPAVVDVHHVHIWSLTEERPVVTLHAVLGKDGDRDRVLVDIQTALRERLGVAHATVQIEHAGCVDGAGLDGNCGTADSHRH